MIAVINDIADMGKSYYLPFSFLGEKETNKEIIREKIDSVKLMVFTGGSDVSPDLYGEEKGMYTYCNKQRDTEETEFFKLALEKNIPIFGVCRGLQFLTVMFGGKLIQHIDGHKFSHNITTVNGEEFLVTSSHHQMAIPAYDDEIIGYSSKRLSTCYLNGENKENNIPNKEVEVVKFRNAKAVGVQYHPETMYESSKGYKYIKKLIEDYLI